MSFVYDGSNLPTNKVDLKPLGDTPSISAVTAAEWNKAMQAILDLRANVGAAEFQVFNDKNDVAVSGAGQVKLRSSNGRLQASSNGDRFRTVSFEGEIYPEDYGAKGDGTTDDGAALQACIDDAAAKHKMVRLGLKTYLTGRELRINSPNHAHIRGTPISNNIACVIKATAGSNLRSVLFIEITSVVEDILVDGSYDAMTAIYLSGASLCTFNSVAVTSTKLDGFFNPGEKDTKHWGSNGIDFALARALRAPAIVLRQEDFTQFTGVTCSITSGSGVVTFTGPIDLTTLGVILNPNLSPGFSVRKGSQRFFGHVVSVDSPTQLTLNIAGPFDTAPVFSASGCDFLLNNYQNAIQDTNAFVNFGGGGNGALWSTSEEFSNFTTIVPNRTNVGPSSTNGCSITSGNDLVTFATFDPLLALVRPGDQMFIGTGVTLQQVSIQSVDTNKVSVFPAPNFTSATAAWSLGRGDCFHECQAADNNIAVFSGTGLIRGCAGVAMAFSGFYGPKVDGLQIDYCGMGAMRIGIGSCFTSLLLRNYFESCGPTGWLAQLTLVNCVGVEVHATLGPAGDERDFRAYGSSGYYMGTGAMYEIGTFRNKLRTNKLESPTVEGIMPANANTVDCTTGNNLSKLVIANYMLLGNAGNGNRALTGLPTFVAPTQGFYTFQLPLAGTATITLYDEYAMGGTKLRLQTPVAILNQADTISFFYDGTTWWETGRSIRTLFGFIDTSASPGNASVTSGHGKSAIASGATSVRITTPFMTQINPFGGEGEISHVDITWLADPGQRWWVERVNGYFDVKLAAAAGADIAFTWRIPQNG